jgi:acyl-CoA thioesterase
VAKVPGLYACTLADRWSYRHPSGGVLMTVALRAMAREVDDAGLTLLSATTHFCQAILPGELCIEVKVLRRGESAAQVKASLTARGQPGPGLEVLGTFTRDRAGPDVHGVTMPSVPTPAEAVAASARTDPEKLPSIYRNLEIAHAVGDPIWVPGWKQGEAHTGFWYRYLLPQRDALGRLDALAIPPIADTMPPALVRRLGPDHERLHMPSLDLTVFFLAPTTSEWLLVETFCERARAGYAVASANLWDEKGQLVARAAQSMTLRPRKRAG